MAQSTYLGEYLVETEVITQEQLQQTLQLQKSKGGYLGQLLVENGIISEQQLCQTLSQLLEINWARIDCVLIGEDVIRLVPRSLAVTCHVLPIFIHYNTLCLAMENPNDRDIIQFIESRTGMQVKPLLAPMYQLQAMIRKYYFHEYSDKHARAERILTKKKEGNTSRTSKIQGKPAVKTLPADGTRSKQKHRKNKENTDVQRVPEIAENQTIRRKRLGEVLVETGLISQKELQEALQIQENGCGFLGKILVEMNLLSEDKLCHMLSDLLYVESVNLNRSLICQEIVELIPGSLAETCRVLPLFVYDEKLYLAMENPLDPSIIQFIEFCTGNEVVPVIAPHHQLRRMIDKYYNLNQEKKH